MSCLVCQQQRFDANLRRNIGSVRAACRSLSSKSTGRLPRSRAGLLAGIQGLYRFVQCGVPDGVPFDLPTACNNTITGDQRKKGDKDACTGRADLVVLRIDLSRMSAIVEGCTSSLDCTADRICRQSFDSSCSWVRPICTSVSLRWSHVHMDSTWSESAACSSAVRSSAATPTDSPLSDKRDGHSDLGLQ